METQDEWVTMFNSPRYQENGPEGIYFLFLWSLFPFPSDFTFQNVKKTRLLHLQVTVTSPNDIRLPKNMWLYLFNNRGWEEFASQHAPFSSLVTIFYFSLIALRISISTLTAGYLIIASDDNIGVSDVAIDRFLCNDSDGFPVLPRSNYIYMTPGSTLYIHFSLSTLPIKAKMKSL